MFLNDDEGIMICLFVYHYIHSIISALKLYNFQ